MTKTKTEAVADQLRDQILTGRYKAGDRLPSERELVERLGVHRGAVREGLRAVAQQGLIEIKAGGPRIRGLQNATLDIVGPLLELEDPPNAEMVRQLLEVHTGLSSLAVRLAVERADEPVLEKARSLLRQMETERSDKAYFSMFYELLHHLIEASGNLVLQLVRRGLRLRFLDQLRGSGITVRPPQKLLALFVRDLDRAIQERRAEDAAALVHALLSTQRETVLKQLEQMRSGGAPD